MKRVTEIELIGNQAIKVDELQKFLDEIKTNMQQRNSIKTMVKVTNGYSDPRETSPGKVTLRLEVEF